MNSIEDYKVNFKDHKITVLWKDDQSCRFLFRNPNSYEYWFKLTCAENMIAMQGDCYTLFIEPGYGRDGLAFLRGSVKSTDYFLEKCPFRKHLIEFNRERALENFQDEHESGYITEEQLESITEELSDEDGIYGETSYWTLCHEYKIDEPGSPMVLTGTTKLQLAGLQCFVEEYEKMFNMEETNGTKEISNGGA